MKTPMTMTVTHPASQQTVAEHLAFVYRRHAVRNFRPDPIDDDTIWAMLDAAVHAPTAMHQEPWRFVVVQDQALLHWLSERAKALAVARASAHGNSLKPPGSAGDGARSPMADPAYSVFYNAETLIVICANIANDFVVADCWLAAENLTLAAASLGLGSCVIGEAVEALNADDVKQRLGIPLDMTAIAPVILGAPAQEPFPSGRKAPVVLSWFRG